MKINLIKYIKRVLGITALETENQFLKENYELILQRFFKQEDILRNVTEDNRTIIRQIKLINDDFMVGRVATLEKAYSLLYNRFEVLERLTSSNLEDNRLIIKQIRLINDDFIVGADLGNGKSPSTVSVIRKGRGGKPDFVKVYNYNNDIVMEDIYRFLEQFNSYTVTIDKPRGVLNPKFRF